jgi:hypothetical protein
VVSLAKHCVSIDCIVRTPSSICQYSKCAYTCHAAHIGPQVHKESHTSRQRFAHEWLTTNVLVDARWELRWCLGATPRSETWTCTQTCFTILEANWLWHAHYTYYLIFAIIILNIWDVYNWQLHTCLMHSECYVKRWGEERLGVCFGVGWAMSLMWI